MKNQMIHSTRELKQETQQELLNYWHNLSNEFGWLMLCEKIGLPKEQLDYLEQLDENFLEICLEAKRQFFSERVNNWNLIQEFKKEIEEDYGAEWVRERKAGYSQNQKLKINERINELEQYYLESQERDDPFWVREATMEMCEYKSLIKTRKSLDIQIYFLQHHKEFKKEQITPDMILTAKNYPIQNLIEVNSFGFALCPFHEDKSPSLFTRNNYFHCFGCNWSGDTIKFIMEREGLNFVEAVRRLQ